MRGMWTTEQDGAGEHRGQGEGRCTGPGSSGGNTEWGREVGRVCDIQGPMRRVCRCEQEGCGARVMSAWG